MSLERDQEAAGEPVTAYNWQDPPFNRWAFWHVSEILPTYQVARGDGPARVLPASAAGLVWAPPTAGMSSAYRTPGTSAGKSRQSCAECWKCMRPFLKRWPSCGCGYCCL